MLYATSAMRLPRGGASTKVQYWNRTEPLVSSQENQGQLIYMDHPKIGPSPPGASRPGGKERPQTQVEPGSDLVQGPEARSGLRPEKMKNGSGFLPDQSCQNLGLCLP